MSVSPRLMTKAEAAAYCAVTPSRFYQLVKAGTLPGAIPGTTRYDRIAIDRALDKLGGLTPYDSSFDEALRLLDEMSVPEGYRLVPIEPTDRMMLMGGFRFAGKVPNSEVFKEVRKGWDDMLSVAPEPSKATGGQHV